MITITNSTGPTLVQILTFTDRLRNEILVHHDAPNLARGSTLPEAQLADRILGYWWDFVYDEITTPQFINTCAALTDYDLRDFLRRHNLLEH